MRLLLPLALSLLTASAAGAMPLSAPHPAGATPTQFSRGESAEVRRCMRRKFGPSYYRGVKRAHRLMMAQACGG